MGSHRQELIDVHAHIVPRSLPRDPTLGAAPWPSVHCAACGTKAVVRMGEKPFREIDHRSWDPQVRIADMDESGVTAQALSPMPELLSYWIDPAVAAELYRGVNGAIADMTMRHPGRFHGLGAVPMQDPDLAAKEMLRLKSDHGLRGIEVGSNINGQYLGDRRFDPVFAAAVELDLCIFVHALHPLQAPHIAAHPLLAPFAAFPVDTALCAATLIMDGVLDRFPALRIGFSHGGGALGPIVHRLEHGWAASNGFDGKLTRAPREYAARFFYDSLVYEPAYAAHLATQIAPGHIFLGTDYPYQIMEAAPAAFIESVSTLTGETSAWAGAARRFLGLGAP